jgi:phosphoribosylformylglycinamidine cyclo-ligase
MGTRMEIYTNEKDADRLISIAKSFGVNAQVIGRVEAAVKKELVIKVADKEIIF